MSEVVVILWTCSKKEEAQGIIRTLLEKKWIACANLIPKVHSIYTWKGKIEESEEILIFLKTQKKHFDSIKHCILESSSYEVPEILQIEVQRGLEPYLGWVQKSTS